MQVKEHCRRSEWVIRVRLGYLFFIISVPSHQGLYGLSLSFSQRSQLHSVGPVHRDLFSGSTTTSFLSPSDNGAPLLLILGKWTTPYGFSFPCSHLLNSPQTSLIQGNYSGPSCKSQICSIEAFIMAIFPHHHRIN